MTRKRHKRGEAGRPLCGSKSSQGWEFTDHDESVNCGRCLHMMLGTWGPVAWAHRLKRLNAKLEERIKELESDNRMKSDLIFSCGHFDKTEAYEYGQPDGIGRKPGGGKRWKTPREIAKDHLGESVFHARRRQLADGEGVDK